MIVTIPLSTEQRERILEMFRYYYASEVNEHALYLLPDIDDNGVIEYDPNKPKIHWYELVSNILIKKITNNNFYWTSVYLTKCIHYYSPKHVHPVDFVYEKFISVINNESLFKITENDYVVEKEQKEAVKEAKKKKNKVKPIVSENVENEAENDKNYIKQSDFFNNI